MTTSHKRKPLPLQLSPGKDNDLIEWLANIEKGDRNQVVKDMLRRGIGLPPPAPAQPILNTDGLGGVLNELNALRHEVRHNGNGIDPALIDRIATLEAYTFEQLTQAANHINTIYQRLDAIASATGSDTITPNAPEVEISRASDEQLEKRSKKLKGSSW